MSMTQTIEIDGQPVKFRASAAIPRIYRMRFHRDIYRDLAALEKSLGNQDEGNSNLDLFSLYLDLILIGLGFDGRTRCRAVIHNMTYLAYVPIKLKQEREVLSLHI